MILLAAGALALVLLFLIGDWGERAASVVYLVAIIVTPLVDDLHIQNWRYGVAGVEVAVLVAIWILAEVRERWWLTAAAGFQLIAVLTFVIPWIMPPGFYFVWTEVSIRHAVWLLLVLTFFAGAMEAWAARRFAREAKDHAEFELCRSRSSASTSE
ncbi:MAG: hypothetical protein ACI8U3_001788 [Brevundimonas sp.]|jgi:hypothetical protein|uniref:hypothetical protein n=1 Tax=Brevundimonas sp. TaxID=1871086 RepID=UPI0039E21C89